MESKKKPHKNITPQKLSVGLWRSVRVKFVIIIVSILLAVIAGVATSLAVAVIRPYKQALANTLFQQTKILLDNLDLQLQNYFSYPQKEDSEVVLLNRVTFPEVRYVVVTGISSEAKRSGFNHVLLTDYPDILTLIDTPQYIQGISRFCPAGIDEILARLTRTHNEATALILKHTAALKNRMEQIRALGPERQAAVAKRRSELQAEIDTMEEEVQIRLALLAARAIGSYPEYSIKNFSSEQKNYLFYKPIIVYNPAHQQSPQESIKGIVFVGISTEGLQEQITRQQAQFIRLIINVSVLVLIIGMLSVWLLSSFFVRPLGLLAAHVALIRDTQDKEKLAGTSVQVTSQDEFGMLGATINDMTESLAAAASLSKDLNVGKEIQKMFIPLDLSSSGRKLTTGSHRDRYCEFFGYYEGAHGVSGDYFDYRKLDGYHYAVIKCDVAGKGVPAALIMVEIATLFQNYFQNWTYERNGYNLSGIVMQINDVIESHGFIGRFAAFSLCIINMRTGDAYFCNAGDNIVHVYDKQEKRLKSYTLRSGSAAGAFSSEVIGLSGGYPVEKIHLNSGDILFLYTDGIEESQRNLCRPVSNANNGARLKAAQKSIGSRGAESEMLGKQRVEAIIESVFAKKKFTLNKKQCDGNDEILHFDFSSCDGTIEEAVLALISVEKVFRMYKDTTVQSFDCVQVDKKIDTFLSKYFLQYAFYCCDKTPHPIYDEYFYYQKITEDIQYDDLTILGIARRVPEDIPKVTHRLGHPYACF